MKHVKFPDIPSKLGLGFGMDMPWQTKTGFVSESQNKDKVTNDVKLFFAKYDKFVNYVFVAFQPKNRNILNSSDYFDAYDDYFKVACKNIPIRALHQTILNMGSYEKYNKEDVCEFTNLLVQRYNFKWVVEDIGIWSLKGKALPYPLPPVLTEEGLKITVSNVINYQSMLNVPLCIEFPGFTEGNTIFAGNMDAFEFFSNIAYETGSPVTIDIGHVLSYQWYKGRNNKNDMWIELEKLPLKNCFELHLSGCSIHQNKFRDMHHGILLDEQIELLDFFLENCSNLKAITYEDPKFLTDGNLIPKSITNFERLMEKVGKWKSL